MKKKCAALSVMSAGVLTVGAAVVTAGDLLPYHRRAATRCTLPNYPYVRSGATNPVSKETFAGEPLVPVFLLETTTPESLGGMAPRFWQMRAMELRDAHCSLSQVTLWVDPTGEWRLSFTAEQNPLVGPNQAATPQALFLRNKFYVKIRAVAAEKSATDMGILPVAGPEMFCIEIPPFWVERSERKNCSYRGTLPASDASRLKYVDRLWVDLSWE